MRRAAILAAITPFMLGLQVASAQRTEPQHEVPAPSGAANTSEQSMMMMDSLNRRVDSLLTRMNRAPANKKVTAMAEVINELVVQRKAMQGNMYEMMERQEGMMHMMKDSSSPTARIPARRRDSAISDTGHAAHHPSQ